MLCLTRLTAVAAVALLVTSVAATAEPRVFTNTEGQEIIAEIVSAKGTTVVLRKDGREIETSITIYSQEDQAFIRNWMKENPAQVDYRLVIEASKKKLGRTSSPVGYYNFREATWAYVITVENRSRDTASGLTLEYRIFKENNVNEGYPRRPNEINEKKGSVEIPNLKTNRKAEITTDSFVLSEIDYYTTNDFVDELMGILLRILDPNGKVVAEYKEGKQEITQREWDGEASGTSSAVIVK